jgi:hypothetical protein
LFRTDYSPSIVIPEPARNAVRVVGTYISGTEDAPLDTRSKEYNCGSPGSEPEPIDAALTNIPPSCPAKKYLPVFRRTIK